MTVNQRCGLRAPDHGLHVAAFIGETNGSRTYSSADTSLLQRIIVGQGTGFTAYQLADPMVIADVNRSNTLTSADASLVQRLIVGTPINQAPPPPDGIIPPAAGGPDPRLFIPKDLIASPGDTITIPVRLEVTELGGISVSGMDLAITYDPAIITSVSNFQVGSLMGTGWSLTTNADTPGIIRATFSKGTGPSLAHGDLGVVYQFDAMIAAGAPNGAFVINLMQNVGSTFTAVTDNDFEELVLLPAPTNADNDAVDGLVTIGSVSAVELAIEAADAVKAEGNTGGTPFIFTVTRSGDTSGVTTVDYAVTGSGANPANAADFVGGVLPSGTVTFLAGVTSQTITIDVAGDYVVEPDEGFVITLSNPSAPATITSAAATGMILNDDTAGIVVDAAPNLKTKEDGSTATFTVVLASQPTADVVIGLSSSDVTEGTVAPGSLTFTAANWNVPQTVTVTGVDDDVVDGHVGYTIVTAAAVSADPIYNGLDADNVPLTNLDDDGIGVFGATSVVVYRVGDGTGNLVNTGNAVFLDEFAPHGALIQTIGMPTGPFGDNRAFFAGGTATSEGFLSRSTDGQYLVLTGYASTHTSSLSGSTGATVNRVVGRVNAQKIVDTTTALADFSSGNNPRSAATVDGSGYWVGGGAGGVRYVPHGGATSEQLTNLANVRNVRIYDGQLYVTSSSSAGGNTVSIGTVGTGLPTSDIQTLASLPGLEGVSGTSRYDYFLADLSEDVVGVDTLYLASDNAHALRKYSLVGETWVLNGTIGVTADGYRGVIGVVNGSTVTLYATRRGGSGPTGGGELVSIVDSSGYNGEFTGTPTLLASAAPNTAFRGVALAPQGLPPIEKVEPTITASPLTKVYDGQAFEVTATADDEPGGFPADNDQANFSFTFYAGPNLTGGALPGAPTNAGSYSVDIAYAGNANYNPVASTQFNFTITAAPLAVTGLTGNDKVYDATTAATVSGSAAVTPLGSDDVTLAGTPSFSFADKNVGADKPITASGFTLAGADAGNYQIVQPVGLTGSITAAPLSVTGLTGNDKVYDATTAATVSGSATVAPLGSDDVTLAGTPSFSFADKNVGANKPITASGYTLVGADAGNYEIVQPVGLIGSISAAPLSVTGLTGDNKVYDATTAATVSGTAAVAPLGSDNVTLAGTPSFSFADKNVGADKPITASGFTLAGPDADNYQIVQPVDLQGTITAAPLAVAANPSSKTVGEPDPPLTFNAVGLVVGDTAATALTGALKRDLGEDVGTYNIVQGTLAAIDGNYDIDFTGAIFEITDLATPVITVNSPDKVYDRDRLRRFVRDFRRF
jgi:hypothetical protein